MMLSNQQRLVSTIALTIRRAPLVMSHSAVVTNGEMMTSGMIRLEQMLPLTIHLLAQIMKLQLKM
jgi:hypothetical protein